MLSGHHYFGASSLDNPPPSKIWSTFFWSRRNHSLLKCRVTKSSTGIGIDFEKASEENAFNHIIPFLCSATDEDLGKINKSEILYFCTGHVRPTVEYFDLKYLTMTELFKLQNLFKRILYSADITVLFAKQHEELGAIESTESRALNSYPVSQVNVLINDPEKLAYTEPHLFPMYDPITTRRDWLFRRGWEVLKEFSTTLVLRKVKTASQVIYSDKEYT